jgi:hypothetical protein
MVLMNVDPVPIPVVRFVWIVRHNVYSHFARRVDRTVKYLSLPLPDDLLNIVTPTSGSGGYPRIWRLSSNERSLMNKAAR